MICMSALHVDARMQNEIDLNECDRSEIDLGPQLHDTYYFSYRIA